MSCSVLLITYNHALYIEQAIDSILTQKLSCECEIILLDDHSTDNTFEIASRKLAGIKNCQLIKNEKNLGITRNYQKGFSLCKGEFVFVLEGDDYWTDFQKMDKQIKFLETHPQHSMCFHSFVIQKGTTKVFEPYSHGSYDISDTYSISDLLLDSRLIGNFSICCYRKKMLDQLPNNLFNHVAYDWVINMFMGHFGLLGRIDEVMSVYRHSKDATWSNKSMKKQLSNILNLIPVYDSLLEYKYSILFQQLTKKIQDDLNSVNGKSGNKNSRPHLLARKLSLFVGTKWNNFVKKANAF